jgi:hypothetical protein
MVAWTFSSAPVKQRLFSLWKASSPRRRKLLVWSTSILLFYTVFGFLILPWIVKAVAVKQIAKQLDRETTIRQVRINPYVLSGTIRGLLVKDKDGQPFLSLDEAYANFQLASFFGRPWVFKEVRAVNPYCRVQINPDYSFNFSDLLTKFSQPAATPSAPAKPLYLHVGKFEITGAGASVTDLTTRSAFHRRIGPVQITLTEMHTDPQNPNPYTFVGTTDSGEKFYWSGNFSLEPLQSAGDLSLEGLSIPRYSALFQDLVRFEIKDGVVDGRLTYRFTLMGTNYYAMVTNASCSLRSFKLCEPGAEQNVVELDQGAVTGVSADAGARSTEIGEITVNGGRLYGKRDTNSTINFLQLAEPAEGTVRVGGGLRFLLEAATNALDALVQSTNLWSATIHQMAVTNCSVEWDDQATPHTARLLVDEIAMSAHHLSNVAGSNQTIQLSARWNTNGTASLAADIQLLPPAAEATFAASNIDLSALSPYAEAFANLQLTNGLAGLAGTLRMRRTTNALPEVTFRGDARLDDFSTVDEQTEQLLEWKSVQVTGIEAGLQPPTVGIKQIAIVEPSARVAFDTNQTLNFFAILKTPDTNAAGSAPLPAAGAAGPGQPEKKLSMGQKLGGMLRQVLSSAKMTAGAGMPNWTLHMLAITNGLLQFDDHSVAPPVSTSIQDVNGTIAELSSDEQKQAELHLSAKAVRTGPIEINGTINALSGNVPTHLVIIFRNVDLSPGSPYSGKFLGYRLNRGRLGLEAEYEVTARKVKAKNVVVLDQLTLGEKVQSPDATKLPVKLAVALLKDRNGKIEIELPIEGSLDDPNFHVGKVVVHVLVNVVTKLVTSPFAALGALFGGKGEEVSYQDFAPGSAELQAAHASKLDGLVNGLYERPGLELQIEGAFDPVKDRDGLRKQELERRFREQKWSGLRKAEQAATSPNQMTLTPQEYSAFLQAAYDEAVRSGAISNAAGTVGASTGRPGPSQPTGASRNLAEQKGATGLLNLPAPEPTTGVDEMQQLVLGTIPIGDDALTRLAIERARNARERILATGKVEAERLILADEAGGVSTNRACRVFFHLQ